MSIDPYTVRTEIAEAISQGDDYFREAGNNYRFDAKTACAAQAAAMYARATALNAQLQAERIALPMPLAPVAATESLEESLLGKR